MTAYIETNLCKTIIHDIRTIHKSETEIRVVYERENEIITDSWELAKVVKLDIFN